MCFYNFQNNFLIILSESDVAKLKINCSFMVATLKIIEKLNQKNYQNNAFL